MTHAQSTRCPHCKTAFRVSAEQLAAARGSVRCGSCLQVFDAQANLVQPETPRQKPSALRGQSSTAATAQATPPSFGQRLEQSMAKSAATSKPITPPEAPEPSRRYEEDDNLLFNEDEEELNLSPEDDDDFLFFDDNDEDDFIVSDPDNDAYETAQPSESSGDLEFSDSFLTLDNNQPKPHETLNDNESATTPASAADDSWALDMLADMEREEKSKQPTQHHQIRLDDDAAGEPAGFKPDAMPPRDDTMVPRGATAPSDTTTAARGTHRAAFALHDMDDELDDLAADPKPSRGRRFGLVALAFLLSLATVGQVLWWERERLSQQPMLEGIYSWVCQWTDCAFLDAGPNAGVIRALSSVLRPLPDGRMRLDAVFVNRGERPAPFPMLVLTLENSLGEVVADGLFAPDDYVGGELRPTDSIPPGRPISVSLNINRPVEDLSSFRLTFHY